MNDDDDKIPVDKVVEETGRRFRRVLAEITFCILFFLVIKSLIGFGIGLHQIIEYWFGR